MIEKIIIELLKRPIIEISVLALDLIVCLAGIGVFFYLMCKGLSQLHIKKVSLTGVECDNEIKPKKRIFRKTKGN